MHSTVYAVNTNHKQYFTGILYIWYVFFLSETQPIMIDMIGYDLFDMTGYVTLSHDRLWLFDMTGYVTLLKWQAMTGYVNLWTW